MINNSAVDAILFDLGNVLFPFDWNIAVEKFAEKLGRPPSSVQEALSNPDYAILFYEFGTGRISTPRFVARLNEVLKAGLEQDDVRAIWCSIFWEDKEMTALLKKLSKKYRTFIVSDPDILHWSFLDGLYGLENIIRGAILSFRRGSMKTDQGTFEKIVKDYRLEPGQSVFIDDLEKNVLAAEAAGIRGVVHAGYSSTFLALGKLGIRP